MPARSRTHRPRGRGLLALATSAITVCALAACGDRPEAQSGGNDEGAVGADEQVRIAYFAAAQANSYAQAMQRGIESVAERENASVRVFDGDFKSTNQVNQMQDATASQRFDAFIIDANDGNALKSAVDRAAAQGIKVVAGFVPVGPDLNTTDKQLPSLTATVGISFRASGEAYGRLITKACRRINPCNVAYLPGDNTLPLETARTKGVKAVVAKSPNVRLVSTQAAGYLAGSGRETAQNVLQAESGIDVMASNDQAMTGAESAIKQAGRRDEIKIIGGGASKQAVAKIRAGDWFGDVVNVPVSEGRRAAGLAVAAARGKTVRPSQDSEELSPVGPTVDRDNLGDYKGEWTS